jgi:serine/threonine protein kinase
MQRDLVLIAVLFVLCTNTDDVDGKICPSLDIRNYPRSLEKLRDCTVIMGHLRVVLIDNVTNSSVYENYSFPKLTEIADYLMVFRVAWLPSLGDLFPNLRIIRGNQLFLNFALVVYRMPHLQEIGLTNLQHIARGCVKVDRCPKLCYVKTVNWTALGAVSLDFPPADAPKCPDEFCPEKCGGRCWNNNHCQESSTDLCLHFKDGDKCVETCPKTKVVNYEIMKCMTRDECTNMLSGSWWIFNNTCVNACPLFYHRDVNVEGGCLYMGTKYRKLCNGTDDRYLDSYDSLQEMKGCTHINGSLDIRIDERSLVPLLEEYLGNIVSISGYLKIGRSSVIESLEFLKNLTIIKGEVLDGKKYSLFVFENQNLGKLWNFSNNFTLALENGVMAFHDNPQLCLLEIKKLQEATGSSSSKRDMEIFQYSNGYKSICNQNDMNVTIIEKNPTSVRLHWQRKATSDNAVVLGYTFYYVQVPFGTFLETAFKNQDECDASWSETVIQDNTVELKQLVPFTRYGYYIKTYTTLFGEQTPICYFVTASTEPSEPVDVKAEAKSDTSIVLTWEPPHHPNGNLSQYNIVMYVQKDHILTVQQRDYCDYPHLSEVKEEAKMVPKVATNVSDSNCTCPEKTFLDLFTDDVTCLSDNKLEGCMKTIYNDQTGHVPHAQSSNKSTNLTSYEFKNLQHFTLYIFYVQACNMKEDGVQMMCGMSEMVSQRTKKSKNADVVRGVRVTVNSKNVDVQWSEPEQFNSVLVAYQVEYKRTDSKHSKTVPECITVDEYRRYRQHKILELNSGKYAIRVQAVSLAGPGVFTEWQQFEISADGSSASIYVPIIVVVVVLVVTVGGYFWYKKKRVRDNIHLITTVNPDYAGPIYEEDEWEIDRNDIEILRELGQGTFGMVFEGKIKSRRYPCAIKTVNENATVISRMEFLNEGSVMKTFNDAHHVIKLLGIVSRGQPPLVVMELMERGDLKSYLRRCREPSQNLTTNEMYRMAVEIADGMAYLSAKKYVHRDLAARNCMVAGDHTVKIGDFGMARDVYETDYYKKETVGLLPVRWMAPESLADGVFTSDSDVWSYGVVLWEMATLAEQPYQGLANEEVFHFVKTKGKLNRPTHCPDLLYEVMSACWSWRPNDRPTFSDVVHRLVDHVGEDFRVVAFVFSRLGQELALSSGPRVYNPPALLVVPEEDYFSHYDPEEEAVNLYMGESNRPKYQPFSSQRMKEPSPQRISPGSPASSTFSFDASS